MVAVHAQKIATLVVELTKATNGLDVAASVNLDEITFLSDTALTLFLVEETKRTTVPFQISQGKQRTMTWLVKSEAPSKRVFELAKGNPIGFDKIDTTVKDGTLTIHTGGKNLVRYMFKTVYPPAGIDTVFKRSAFIHPLWSPGVKSLPESRHRTTITTMISGIYGPCIV